MDSMYDLMFLLKIVRAHMSIATDTMKESNYPSLVYMQAKGSYCAYCTVETYISNMVVQKTKKEKEEVEKYERID